jgi:hypothetical protein
VVTAIAAALLAAFTLQQAGGDADAGAGAEDGAIAWRSDLASSLEVARAVGKPLFVVFRCER